MRSFQFAVFLLMTLSCMESIRADEAGETVPIKRPFCNTFSGCDRKRNSADYAVRIQPVITYDAHNQPSIPLLYQALVSTIRGAALSELKLIQRLAEEV